MLTQQTTASYLWAIVEKSGPRLVESLAPSDRGPRNLVFHCLTVKLNQSRAELAAEFLRRLEFTRVFKQRSTALVGVCRWRLAQHLEAEEVGEAVGHHGVLLAVGEDDRVPVLEGIQHSHSPDHWSLYSL